MFLSNLEHSLWEREGVRSTLLTRYMPKRWKMTFPEHQHGSPRSIQGHSRAHLMTPRHHLSVPESILWTLIFHHFDHFWRICASVRMVPCKLERRRVYHTKEHQKPWGLMSRILHLINLSQRYHLSKGSRERQQEDPPHANLAPTGDLEESASHHNWPHQALMQWDAEQVAVQTQSRNWRITSCQFVDTQIIHAYCLDDVRPSLPKQHCQLSSACAFSWTVRSPFFAICWAVQ